jgi:hypothetical protein
MALSRFSISPISMGISSSSPELFTNRAYSPNVVNGRVEQNSFMKRWGYSLDRTLPSKVYSVSLYQIPDGSRFTLYLTANDLMCRKTGTSETWSYITDTYVTGKATVSSPDGLTVTGSDGADFVTAGIAAGDKFILDTNHTYPNREPDTDWATVSSITNLTTIVLTAKYTGTLGAAAGTYKIRRVFSVPTNERWTHCAIDDLFCFTNGNTGVFYYDGAGYAEALDATNAVRAKYCIEYGNRLVLADTYISNIRRPCTIKWSKENDPKTWVDTTAGENDFQDTDNFITGLCKVGSSLIVFRHDSYIVGSRTGVATDPFAFPTHKTGLGCIAPYSIAPYLGTVAWLGRDDFYSMNGDEAVPISDQSGGPGIREKFFGAVGYTEIQNTIASVNHNLNEIYWTANTDEGTRTFVWNYKTGQWSIHDFACVETAFGIGAV